ncbi:hypothetical protein WN48_08117 [Eufriesea mexicana]|uniref:Uncharacterized protein n=1 Tax=Eufriesea mexicana TaxID=516756 RepID=A0A310S872_9HYME|nr:hypothetical protein WN48_08117 [Eufriesea mexicana]
MNTRCPMALKPTVHPLDTGHRPVQVLFVVGEPNFENGKLVCPVFAFIRLYRGVGRLRLDPKRGGPPGPKGETIATVTFSYESSLPVDIHRAMPDRGREAEKPPRVKYGPILYSAVGEGVLGNWNPGITGLASMSRRRMQKRVREKEREPTNTRCSGANDCQAKRKGDEHGLNEIRN